MCYRTAWMEGVRRMGPHLHPTITLTGIAMHHALDAWDRDDRAELRAIFRADAERLAAAGSDFFILPDNSAHIALEAPGDPFPLPGLHIAEVVAERAAEQGYRQVAILGTRWTMNGPVYPCALESRGIGWQVPEDDKQALIHEVIMNQLCLGVFREESRGAFHEIIAALAARGCDAAALVCTEIPLLVEPACSALPLLDSTRLLAHAAIDVALGDRPAPDWRGGPVGP